jgi:hypothetical protein
MSGMLARVVVRVGFIFLLAMVVQGCSGGGGDNGSPSPAQSSSSQSFGAIEVQDLGTHSISNDGSVNLQVQVRAASSFMLIADGGTTAADIDIDSVINPTGAVWVTPSFTDQDPIGRNKLQDFSDTMASGIFPHTPHYSISDGIYTFRVRSFNASSNTHVTAVINHRTNPAGGTLGVNLIFCGIPDINASTALNNSQFQILFQEFVRIYALSNIHVNISGLLDCAPADAGRLSFVNTANEEFGDLLATSGRINNQAMNFFFVQGFENQPGSVGRTGKIAGPSIQGTRYSGVVTTTLDGPIGDLTQGDLLIQGATMAHEGGHYFGLYHTTERFGAGAMGTGFPAWQLVDPINDTPACPAINDVNHDGTVEATECLNLDGRNLMFWLAEDGVVQDLLTAGQQFVLHRHPYLN